MHCCLGSWTGLGPSSGELPRGAAILSLLSQGYGRDPAEASAHAPTLSLLDVTLTSGVGPSPMILINTAINLAGQSLILPKMLLERLCASTFVIDRVLQRVNSAGPCWPGVRTVPWGPCAGVPLPRLLDRVTTNWATLTVWEVFSPGSTLAGRWPLQRAEGDLLPCFSPSSCGSNSPWGISHSGGHNQIP